MHLGAAFLAFLEGYKQPCLVIPSLSLSMKGVKYHHKIPLPQGKIFQTINVKKLNKALMV